MPNVKSKTKAVANIKKNRLHVAMSGNIDTKALEKLYTEIRFCVADLKGKFGSSSFGVDLMYKTIKSTPNDEGNHE